MEFGRYETIREIASGGMGTVFLARAVGEGGFERLVALKVMHKHVAEIPEFEAMFLDEARLAARIRHPNVVATIDVQRAAHGLFLVMDLVEGLSLYAVLRTLAKQQSRLPLEVGLRIVIDALSGLHAAHELKGADGEPLKLVHRDVTPQNILIGNDGIARITDFGVARAEARLCSTKGGQLKGKLAYMPPEQGVGEPIDRRADVYAAGVVLWEVLAHKRLFKAEHEGALIAKIIDGVTRSPREENPGLPQALDEACMQALARQPADRYATAAAFAEAIENAAVEAGITIAGTRGVASFLEAANLVVEMKPEPGGALVPRPRLTLDSFGADSNVSTSVGSAQVAVLSTQRPVGRRVGVAAAVLLPVGLVVGWLMLSGTSDEAPAAAPITDSQATTAASTEAPSAATETTSEAPATSASAAASSAQAALDPSAQKTAKPKSTSKPAARPGPRSGRWGDRKQGPSGFRPGDL